MEYEIKGVPLPVVICYLKKGDVMLSDSGAMAWMDPCMEMGTTSNGGIGKAFGRMFSGETMFLNSYTANADGKIAFSSSFPGEIRKYDIEVQGYFIIGLPGETFTSAMNTIKWIDELTCNDYVNITHIAVLVPYPGTPIFLNPEQYKMKIINSDFSKYIMNCDYMNTGVPIIETEELNNFQIYALWQLALSTASKNFRKKSKKNVPEMFNALYEFWNEITFYE